MDYYTGPTSDDGRHAGGDAVAGWLAAHYENGFDEIIKQIPSKAEWSRL